MIRDLLLRIATAAFAVLAGYGVVHAHDCPCPPGCVPSATVTPGPAPTPSPKPTIAPPQPTKIVSDFNLNRMLRTPFGSGYGGSRSISDGETLVGVVDVGEFIPAGVVPNRIVFERYSQADRDCGNLAMGVEQLCGTKQIRPIPSFGTNDGSVEFPKRIGRTEDPNRVCRGMYVVTLRGGPTPAHDPDCKRYLINWGWR